jgi:hypothetical protein
MTITRTRDDRSKKGTHGVIRLGGKTWHTIEPPDLGNKPFESCVPLGDYDLIPFSSDKYGEVFLMVNPDLNVYEFEYSPGRPDGGRYLCILAHRGNEIVNFVGCGGCSHSYDEVADRLCSSTTASCVEFNKLVADEGSFKLTVEFEFE